MFTDILCSYPSALHLNLVSHLIHTAKEDERVHVQKCLNAIEDYRRDLNQDMNSRVYADFERKYPEDMEV